MLCHSNFDLPTPEFQFGSQEFRFRGRTTCDNIPDNTYVISLPQALTKRIPLAECHRDAQVAAWFVEDKLTRQSAWGCMRGLLAQLEGLGIDRPATRSRLSGDVCIRPVEQGEEMVMDEHGVSYLKHADGELTPVLPPGFTVHSMWIIANVIDRGSIGAAAVNFAKGGAQMTDRYVW